MPLLIADWRTNSYRYAYIMTDIWQLPRLAITGLAIFDWYKHQYEMNYHEYRLMHVQCLLSGVYLNLCLNLTMEPFTEIHAFINMNCAKNRIEYYFDMRRGFPSKIWEQRVIIMSSKFLHFLWKQFFPGEEPVPSRLWAGILNMPLDTISAIWLAEVRKCRHIYSRHSYGDHYAGHNFLW